jgi:hypothetical protein
MPIFGSTMPIFGSTMPIFGNPTGDITYVHYITMENQNK